MIEDFKQRYQTMTLEDLITEVLEKSGLKHQYTLDKETDRLENIKELISDAIDFSERYPEADLIEYLQMVSLYGD